MPSLPVGLRTQTRTYTRARATISSDHSNTRKETDGKLVNRNTHTYTQRQGIEFYFILLYMS